MRIFAQASSKNYETFYYSFIWESYDKLPAIVQEIADKNYELLKRNPKHPSLHFKKAKKYWSARVGIKYRAVAIEITEGLLWFWIGTHAEYDKFFS